MHLSKLTEVCSKKYVLLCGNYTSIKILISNHNIVLKRKQSLLHDEHTRTGGAEAEHGGLVYRKGWILRQVV